MPKLISSSTLKLTAYAAMVIDHAGLMFLPDVIWPRLVGRISFPLFAFLVAFGSTKTKNSSLYLFRLSLFALISQIPYALFMKTSGVSLYELNIFFTLAAGLGAILAMRELSSLSGKLASFLMILLAAELFHFDYGAYGVLLILASYVLLSKPLWGISTMIALNLANDFVQQLRGIFAMQTLSIAAVPLMLWHNGSRGFRLPRHIFYWFYPAHLLILFLIKILI